MAEIAAGVGLAWARRDEVGLAASVAAMVPGVVGVPSALSMLAALVPVDVAAPSSTVSAVAFVLVLSLALPVSPFVASACSCCSAVS